MLVLVKKLAMNTPRRQDDTTLEEEFSPSLPPVFTSKSKIESNNNNDDTLHDVCEQENKIDKLTDLFLRTFIDGAIDQGKEIERLKKEIDQKTSVLTQEAKEWMSEEDLTNEDLPKHIDTKSNEFAVDLSGFEEENPDKRRVESLRKSVMKEAVTSLVPHTREQVIQLSDQAIQIFFDQNVDFSNRSTMKCKIPNSYFTYNQQDSDNEDVRRNRRAYCQMVFDLCVELLHEMHSANVQLAKYPDWQKTKLVSKRYYRAKKPEIRDEMKQFIQIKMLEILNLNSRQITYSKWGVSNKGRHNSIEKFEIILNEELRRIESRWINYDDESIQIKLDIADLILDQLIEETLTECFHVFNKRLFSSSNSTYL